MLFDSHAHINEASYSPEERAELIKTIEASDVDYVADIGYDLASSKLAVEHAARYPWCYAVVGCHPHDAKSMDDMELAMYKGLARKKKVVAIGEIGLDFHYDHSPRDIQREWFRRQIRLANQLKMPIVIHSREADQETMDILKEEGAFSEERKSWFPKRPDPSGYTLKKSEAAKENARRSGRSYGRRCQSADPLFFRQRRAGSPVRQAGSDHFCGGTCDIQEQPQDGGRHGRSTHRLSAGGDRFAVFITGTTERQTQHVA